MQNAAFEEAVNGCKASDRSKLILAWIAAERLKREMRGIPPLKAISVPLPMRKARARLITNGPTEVEVNPLTETKGEEETRTPNAFRGVCKGGEPKSQDKNSPDFCNPLDNNERNFSKESIVEQTVTAPPPPAPPNAPVDSLVHPPSQSTSPGGGLGEKKDGSVELRNCPVESPVNLKNLDVQVPPGEEKYPWKVKERRVKAAYLERLKARKG